MKKTSPFTLACRRFGLAALSAFALPAFAGTLTITSGPTFNPAEAFSGSTIGVQVSHVTDGDVASMTGDVTITPPAVGAPGSDSISFTANFVANPGDVASAAYNFTVTSTDSRNFSYRVTGTAMIAGLPPQMYSDEGTISPGTNTYSGSVQASTPFPVSASGTFTGQLTITPITVLSRGVDPSGIATGTLSLHIAQGDFQLAGGIAPPLASAQLRNLSSRAMIMGGDQDAIAGFIITGSAPKRVLIRGIGPSLPDYVPTKLGDPSLTLMHITEKGAELVAMNNDWRSDAEQEVEIEATGLAPMNDLESAIVATLNPGTYTAQLSGHVVTALPAGIQTNVAVAGSTGIGLVEIYDLDSDGLVSVGNLSTRAMVLTDDNVLIGGVIVGGGGAPGRVIVRAIGPSMEEIVPGSLADPTLELFDADGMSVAFNDDWQDDENAEELGSLEPSNEKESALARDLTPGNYTAVVRGKDRSTGIGLVEFFLQQAD